MCNEPQICVKVVVTMGPAETVTWECHTNTCAPYDLDCTCASMVCGDLMCMMNMGQLECHGGGVCASPDTPIATPDGERAIAELAVGDLVYSMHEGRLAAVPLVQVSRRAVHDHAVVEVTLASGRTLRISGLHPTADGRAFRDLQPNDMLGSEKVVGVATLPYEPGHTYDILPASDSGSYLAAGALVGSTLQR
jgi:hypothetical protein